MRKSVYAILLLGIAAASAQPLTIERGPTTGASVGTGVRTGTPAIEVPVPTSPALPPLTAESALRAKQRLEAYMAYQADVALRPSALREAGLSAENDAVEHTTSTPVGTVGPSYVGLLIARPPTGKDVVDPGLATVSRVALRARLGRDPTTAELTTELRAFDARVAQLNQSLAVMRPQIAKAIKDTGNFPRSLEASALGVAPADPQASSAAASEGFRAVFQTLLTR
jgi:hypothetical protein